MDIREGYIKELKVRLQEYSAKIADLKARAKSFENQEKKYESLGVVDDLEQTKAWIAENIKALESSGESGWDVFSDEIERTFKILNKDYLKASVHIITSAGLSGFLEPTPTI